ncbi:DUF4418 family protein [Terrisporobacter hibernicus]|uniref:DUF4418 family protein n=1 Tax=Terrisporobacter hibernicus TaxID=2813371 RepID=A0AAX2ZJ91_9FIRM|nr:DUF4418 family protein [Terrisporobacter hibernicus]UEL48435.1 DUF4418 family protein [Terrisporobacter hibernicus]
MKNRVGMAMFYIITGLLMFLGPKHIFVGCAFNPERPMKCWWSTQAILGIGILLIIVGICYMLIKSKGINLGMSLMSIFIGMYAIAIPKFLIGGCKKETMPCLTVEFPSIYLICGVLIIVSIINIIYLRKKIEGNK